MTKFNFQTGNVPPRDNDFGLIPAGDYDAYVSESSIEDTKNRNGKVLKLVFVITGPTHAGRKIFERLNVRNPNQEAERIAQQDLRDLCEAVGMPDGIKDDTTELHNKPLTIKVKVRKGRAKDANNPAAGFYDDDNGISRYKKRDASQAQRSNFTPPSSSGQAAAPTASTAAPAAASGSKGAPPWAKNKNQTETAEAAQ